MIALHSLGDDAAIREIEVACLFGHGKVFTPHGSIRIAQQFLDAFAIVLKPRLRAQSHPCRGELIELADNLPLAFGKCEQGLHVGGRQCFALFFEQDDEVANEIALGAKQRDQALP